MHKSNSLIGKCVTGVILLGSSCAFAQDVVINGNQLVNSSIAYKNVTLDMTQGEFTVGKDAILTIENSVINVGISPTNPFFVYVKQGRLNLKNSTVNATVKNINPTPNAQATRQLISVDQGLVSITNNKFDIDTAFTVSLLKTNPLYLTHQFTINGNTIKNFHGGIYLRASNNAEVKNNTFERVSLSNIYNYGDLNLYQNNIFSFAGNLTRGDAFDIINSTSVLITDNIIASSAGYGIYVEGAKNLLIDDNKITDNMAYGIYVSTAATASKNTVITDVMPINKMIAITNQNIIVSNNYIALNKFGLASEAAQKFTVTSNTFIQKFSTKAARQFWTNNDNLLKNVTNLAWTNNLYKEAFTQVNGDSNLLALKFVPFPVSGGVALES